MSGRIKSNRDGPDTDGARGVSLFKGFDDGDQGRVEERQEGVVGDVAGLDDQQPARLSGEQVAVAEVAVLGDHHAVRRISLLGHLSIRGAVSVGQLAGVYGVVASCRQRRRQPSR